MRGVAFRAVVDGRTRSRGLGIAFLVLVAVAIGAAAGLNDYQRVLSLLVVPLIAMLVFVVATGNVEVVALFVLPASYLPLPALHIGSAVFGPTALVAPALLLAGIVAASKEGIRTRLPSQWLYGVFILISILSIGYSWVAWDPAVGSGQAIGQGHRWIGYQLTQLYFLALPFIALSAGTVYSQLRSCGRISGAINIAFALAVFSSWVSTGPANAVAGFELGQKVSTLNYEAAVLLAVVVIAALLWSEEGPLRFLNVSSLVVALGTVLISRYLNPLVALLPALAILLWRRFVHRRVALAAGVLAASGIVLEVVLTNIKLFDFDRLPLWQDALRVWARSPLLGVGPGNLTGYMEAYSSFPRALVLLGYHQAHNTFLELLAEDGVLGLGAFAIFLVLLTRQLVGATGLTPADHRLQASALGLLIASAVMAFVSSGFVPTVNSAGWSDVGIVTLVWLVPGLAVGRLRSYVEAKVSTKEVSPSANQLAAGTESRAT